MSLHEDGMVVRRDGKGVDFGWNQFDIGDFD